jgi:serine/threonine protein kinase
MFEKEISDFKLLDRIGGGAFGTVYLGQLRENEKEFYAVKAMSKIKMVEGDMIEMALLEKDILLTNQHPNLI